MGALLIKGIAAVAEVPRPEDVGIDVIATLLKPAADGNSYAEDTFQVQLKAESIRTVEFAGHSLNWLTDQKLPTFIGSVSLERSRIRLYSTIYVNQASLALGRKRAVLRFGRSDSPPFMPSQQSAQWGGDPNSEDSFTVWLGPPVLEWHAADIGRPEWRTVAYGQMSRFLELVRRELWLLTLGHVSSICWETNNPASIKTDFGMMHGGDSWLGQVSAALEPSLKSLILTTGMGRHETDREILLASAALALALRKIGVSVVSDTLLKAMLLSEPADTMPTGALNQLP